MCEAGEKEIKQCEHLAQVLAESVPPNGRCQYHESLARAVYTAAGGIGLVIAMLAWLLNTTAGISRTLGDHSKISGHPVIEERVRGLEDRLDRIDCPREPEDPLGQGEG